MDSKFAALTESLHGSFERLVGSEPCLPGHKWRRERLAGVHLFSESGRHLYVGRTNDFRGRYGRHCNPGASHRMAAFAFRLAREATGRPVRCRDAHAHLVSGVAVYGTGGICDLLFLRRELVWPAHPDRPDMGHVPAHGVRHPSPFHGYRSGLWLCRFAAFGRRDVCLFDHPYRDVLDLHLDSVA